jgi:hypothetical protein
MHLTSSVIVHSLRCSRDRGVTGGLVSWTVAKYRVTAPSLLPTVVKLQWVRDTLIRLLILGDR